VRPEAGNLTVCAYCQTVLRYGEGLELVEVKPEELAADERVVIGEVVKMLRERK
jgi:hypothetical protein